MRTSVEMARGLVFALVLSACVAHVDTASQGEAPAPPKVKPVDFEAQRHQETVHDSAAEHQLKLARLQRCAGNKNGALQNGCKATCADEAGAVRCNVSYTQCIATTADMSAADRNRTCDGILESCVAAEVPVQVTASCRERCFEAAASQACP